MQGLHHIAELVDGAQGILPGTVGRVRSKERYGAVAPVVYPARRAVLGDAWREWNGKFRDDVRRFLRGDDGLVSVLATRLLASPDLYAYKEREPEESINFVTCHDGFTLNDLVSYNDKHNAANGEQNRDGADENYSWNCGTEGPTAEPEIERIRTRQVKSFLALNLLAIGTPMLLAGDEVRRTQQGNNNAYCQDNEISWFDWSLVEKHAGLRRFVKLLLACRLDLHRNSADSGATLIEVLGSASVRWHGVELDKSRLGAPFPQLGSHSKSAASGSDPALDSECLLGAAQLRASARARGLPGSVAAMDRHRS